MDQNSPVYEPIVLVVDDNDTNLSRAEEVLDDTFEVFTANTGKKALNLINKVPFKFDMVLMDIDMPGQTGIETVREMRAQKIDIPVIFLTTEKKKETIDEAMSLEGIVGYEGKPFDPARLKAIILSKISVSQTQDQIHEPEPEQALHEPEPETEAEADIMNDQTAVKRTKSMLVTQASHRKNTKADPTIGEPA